MKRTELKRSGPIKARTKTTTSKVGKPEVKRSTLKTRQRAVTPEEKALWDRLANEIGCIACVKDGRRNTHVSIHHVDGRTKPGCHLLVLPLCAAHHQDDGSGTIAVHPWKDRFEKRYGQQLELVDECMTILGWIK